MKKRCTLLILLLLLAVSFLKAAIKAGTYSDQYLSKWEDFSHTEEAKKLLEWLRKRAQHELKGTHFTQKLTIKHPPFSGAIGIFITLTKNNRVRGCYGAFSQNSSRLSTVLAEFLHGALRDDHRYKPLDSSELNDTVIIITITSQPIPVNDIYSVDFTHYGLILECNGEKRIFVPAELRSLSYIQSYIKNGNSQYSVFKAITIKGPLN